MFKWCSRHVQENHWIIDAAQAALNYQGNFQIFPTLLKAPTPEPDFIDPDVQSELDMMQPVGVRSQAKQGKKFLLQ
jgi:hypothetical protein